MPLTAAAAGTATVDVASPVRAARRSAQTIALARPAGDADPDAPHGAAARAGRRASRSRTTCSPTSCRAPARVSLSVAPLDARSTSPALLQALDRYPYGCSEQIASRALPLLYVNELARAGASGARRRRRRAHPRRDRAAAGAAGLERLVRPVVGRRRRRCGSTPMSPTS